MKLQKCFKAFFKSIKYTEQPENFSNIHLLRKHHRMSSNQKLWIKTFFFYKYKQNTFEKGFMDLFFKFESQGINFFFFYVGRLS